MALKRGIVELAEYNSNWKKEYEKEEKLLKEVLGDRIIEIHHIGSTSIEGLKAKPVIDILVVINSLDEINDIRNRNPKKIIRIKRNSLNIKNELKLDNVLVYTNFKQIFENEFK